MIVIRKCSRRLWPLLVALAGWALIGTTHAQTVKRAILDRAELAHASGEQLYRHICQGCHMPDAGGAAGAGAYPALAANARLASARYAAAVVLNGRGDMPSFVPHPELHGFSAIMRVDLADAEIAAVVNYIRSHFGNHYDDVLTAADVRALHMRDDKAP